MSEQLSGLYLSGRGRVAGIMGWPVSHSRSPRLHNYWLRQFGIDGAYVPLTVPPEKAEAAIRALPALGFRGANVTLPHKEVALRTMDHLDATAKRIGAVNTILVREDGSLEGRNTDAFGFIENLRHGARGWRGPAGPAVVLGAGGAARAILVALQDAGVPRIRLLNRTAARAEQIAAEIGGDIEVLPWELRAGALADAALLVNTTTQGMAGQPPLDLALDALPSGAVVTDIVYTPLVTPLLMDAATRGNPTVDGIGMLLHQARPGFEASLRRKPDVTDDLRKFVLAG